MKSLATKIFIVLLAAAYSGSYLDLAMFSGERIDHVCGASNDQECCCCCSVHTAASDPMCDEAPSAARSCTCSVSQQGCTAHANAHLLSQNRDASVDVMTTR